MRKTTGFAQLCFVAAIVFPAAAQTTSGSITGQITDQSGAVVPGATIRIANEGTGLEREIRSSDAGVFAAPNLNVGSYRVRAEAAGFQPQERTGILLNANQVVNVDFEMSVSATTTETQVVGTAPVIDTETSTLSYVKTQRDLQQLPLVARTAGDFGFYGYTIFNPGVSKVAGQSNPAINGMRILDTVPTIDGVAVMAYLDGIGGGPVQPSLEGIEQVNIELANPQAEFARPGNFTVVTKSGTNSLHGGAFWDYNGNHLNARNFFSDVVPFRIYHNFGASLGGPIRKNKTFFFADYEGSRESAKTVIVGNTPLVAWRSGDFSALGRTINDPLTGQPFPGNRIPANRIDPVSQKIQDFFYPLPNFGGPDLQSGNWRGQRFGQNGFTRFDNVDVRVDHTFREKDIVFTRVSYRRLPVLAYEATLPPVGQRNQLRNTRSAIVSWTHSFSPAVLNEFRTGFTRMRNFFEPDLIGRDILRQVGIEGIGVGDPIHNVPAFNITGITSTDQPNSHTIALNTNFQWTDNVSWTRKSHFFKFGVDIIRDQIGGGSLPNSIYGTYNFNGTFTGFGYADFLLGIPQQTTRTIPTRDRYLRGTMWGFYAQDQFKVNSSLTLNYGVRWELQGPYYDKFGAIFSFDPVRGAIVVPDDGVNLINPLYPKNIQIETASQAGYPRALVDFDRNNVYPRAGFAYKPFGSDRTVIRGGYGLYGNTIYGSAASGRVGGPFAGSETFTNTITNGVPLFRFPQPFLNVGTTATQNASGINPRLRTPYSQQFNLTIERQIGRVGLRVGYVGTRSTQLVYQRNANQPPPSTIPFTNARRIYQIFNMVTWYDNGGTQQYNALQVSASKTYGSDLVFNAGWTWAKDLTDTQNTGSSFSGPLIENQYNRAVERGDNVLTRTHRVYGNLIYSLPFGRGRRHLASAPGIVEALAGGWSMSWIFVAQSGQFFNPVFSGFDVSNTNTIGGRPDRIGSGQLSDPNIRLWFDPAAFKIPGCPDSDPVCRTPANVGRFGNSGNNILRGPGSTNFDFSAMKYFRLTEALRLQFRVLATNIFNHPNFANPPSSTNPTASGVNISSPATVGRITSTFAEQVGEDARQVHFSIRFEF